jgi:hypothetical protein
VGDAVVGVEIHRHAQQHHEGSGKLASAPLGGIALFEDLGDGRLGDDPGEGLERNLRSGGGIGVDVAYP